MTRRSRPCIFLILEKNLCRDNVGNEEEGGLDAGSPLFRVSALRGEREVRPGRVVV